MWQKYPTQRPIRTTEPTPLQEPVTLAEAKRQCGLSDDVSYHDDDVQRLVTAARQTVESDTGIVCYTGTFTWKFTEWPCADWFELPSIRPVTSVSSITYVDTSGTTTTWSSSAYSLETAAVTQFVRLKHLESWPTLRGDINGIVVTFVAGYASVVAVPADVKNAVLMQVKLLWDEREGVDGRNTAMGYDRLVNRLMRSSYP